MENCVNMIDFVPLLHIRFLLVPSIACYPPLPGGKECDSELIISSCERSHILCLSCASSDGASRAKVCPACKFGHRWPTDPRFRMTPSESPLVVAGDNEQYVMSVLSLQTCFPFILSSFIPSSLPSSLLFFLPFFLPCFLPSFPHFDCFV